jgi:DNA-binding response OmpR family regulator
MDEAKRILLVSVDPDIAAARALVLRDAGYHVTVTTGRGEAERALAGGEFDVFVLCHTVASGDALALAQAFRRINRNAKVVAVISGLFLAIRADRVVQTLDGPHALLAAVDSLFHDSPPLR